MKVLFQSRKTLFTVPGGDTVQLVKTAEFLRKLGIEIDISTELEPDLCGYDLVHLFNLMRPQEVFLQARNAKRQGKRVALSTIYGLYTEYERKARGGLLGGVGKVLNAYQIEYMKVIARGVLNEEFDKGTLFFLRYGYLSLQKQICNLTDVFLPNSESEMKRVEKDMSLTNYMHVTVPNAVDTAIFNPYCTNISQEVEQYKDCVLCVARIEGRKSQLNLVRAMKGLPWKLVLIGKPAPNHFGYFESIKKEAGQNVSVLGHVIHEMLPQFYKAAKVHALISWMETPGLSSLEAGVMGCNLVITEKGDTRDYFGDYAYYCEPDSVESIRNAIIRAYESSQNLQLREHIIGNFTWEKTAQKTLKGYMKAMHV